MFRLLFLENILHRTEFEKNVPAREVTFLPKKNSKTDPPVYFIHISLNMLLTFFNSPPPTLGAPGLSIDGILNPHILTAQ